MNNEIELDEMIARTLLSYDEMKTNSEILARVFITNNLEEGTTKKYKVAWNSYCNFHKLSIHELLIEAEQEEEAGVKWKHSKLKQRLIDYRIYLIQNDYASKTIQTYLTQIFAVYHFYDIETKKLPKVNYNPEKPILFSDLPDKEILRQAYEVADPMMKAALLFMSSSGCPRTETLNLTVADYIDATKEYHNNGNIEEIINELSKYDIVVPTFHMMRAKTKKYFTTFCSPEAVKAINTYLATRENLRPDDKLFDISYARFGAKFKNINNKLKLGNVKKYGRLRSHMLRKFHASMLYNDGMSLDKINDLQGKTKNTTDSSYFFIRDEDLKSEYIEHLDALQINKDVEKVTVKSKEFMKMEIELKEKDEIIDSQQKEIAEISSRQDNLEKMVMNAIGKDKMSKIDKLL